MLHALKRFVPATVFDAYHRALSWLAAAWYRHPSSQLIVIGVTGTNGKTTTSYFISKALEAVGDKTGCTTTALFKIDSKEWLNDKKMTMLGRFALQRMLREMVDAGCSYAVIETSSQGIVQHRHRAIAYDVAVFTNLTPEHIEAHGGFENYKQAKIELFRHVAARSPKVMRGKLIPKIAVLNRDSEFSKEFAVRGLDRVVWYGRQQCAAGDVCAREVNERGWLSSFTIDGLPTTVHVAGLVNVENATAAVATATAVGMPLADVLHKIEEIHGIPGRFERIDLGQPFTVLVDYAPEPASLEKCYEAIQQIPHARLIHVLGSAGGGRDVARRPILGRMAAEQADVVIITNEDPYDDEPRKIIEQVAEGARAVGRSGVVVRTVQDRREAIFAAVKEAQAGDLVLLTGKGCELAIMVANGGKIPWDEREVARAAIRAILPANPNS